MKITVTTILPTPSGLRLGLRVEHEKAGWLRFATTVVLYENLSPSDCRAITAWLNKRVDDYLETEQDLLPLDWG